MDPTPESLGLETVGPTPESLGLETEEPKGVFGKTEEKLKSGVGFAENAWDKTKDVFNSAGETLRNTVPGDYVDVAKEAVMVPFKAIGKVVEAVDKGVGTVAAKALDPMIQLTERLTGQQETSLMKAAEAREAATPRPGVIGQYFPVRLIEDIVEPAARELTNYAGEKLEGYDSKTAKEAGQLLKYVSPAVGFGAGLMAFGEVADIAKFGQLTAAGVEAEKAGELAGSMAERIAAKQQNILNLKAGPLKAATSFGEFGLKAAQKASNMSVAFDASSLGKTLNKFTTYSNYPTVNYALDKISLKRNVNESYIKQLDKAYDAQANKFGLDLADKEVQSTLQKAFDNPSKFTGTDLVSKEAAEGMYDYMNTSLQIAVQKAKKSGIEIPEKLFTGAEGESERYVPRVANREALNQMQASRVVAKAVKDQQLGEYNGILDELDEASSIAEKMGVRNTSRASGDFLRLRDIRNTESMNAMVKENFGVDNFFSTDISQAYLEKIHSINKSVAEKEFVKSVTDQFGLGPAGNLVKKTEADARIAEAVKAGGVISPEDLRISRLGEAKTSLAQDIGISKMRPGAVQNDLVSFEELPRGVRSKLQGLERMAPDEFKGIMKSAAPREITDRMAEILAPERLQGLTAGAVGVQNVFKAFVTQNPGYYSRNWFQSYVMGRANGVSIPEMIKSFAGKVADKGKWAGERPDLYEGLSRGMGSYGDIEQQLSKVQEMRKVAKVEATVSELAGDSAMKEMWVQFRQMNSTGSWKEWLNDLRTKGSGEIRNNPIFKIASGIGHGGEDIPKFAYFNKLMDAGYDAETAMSKVQKQFLNFENTRLATKKAAGVFPFINHAIKNVEVTMRLLADSPGTAMMYGPGGALQRAIENWAGWDPDQTSNYRDMMGPWAHDQILLTVMPGKEDMNAHKDLLRDIVNKMWSGAPEGSNAILTLPSNYHALTMWDPSAVDSQTGPILKAGIALFGIDPFTGKPLQSVESQGGLYERMSAAANQIMDPMMPKTTINLLKAGVDKLGEAWASNASKLGNSEDMSKAILTDQQSQRAQKQIAKALVKTATFGRGTFTQLDQDMIFRITAKLNTMKQDQKSILSGYKSGKEGADALQRARDVYIDGAKQVQEMIDIKDDYENRLKRTNAPAWHIDVKPDPKPGPQVQPVSFLEKLQNTLIPSANAEELQQPEQSSFGRASDLYRKNMSQSAPQQEERPQEQQKEENPNDQYNMANTQNLGDIRQAEQGQKQPSVQEQIAAYNKETASDLYGHIFDNADEEESKDLARHFSKQELDDLKNDKADIDTMQNITYEKMDSIIPNFRDINDRDEAALGDMIRKLSSKDRRKWNMLAERADLLEGKIGDQGEEHSE